MNTFRSVRWRAGRSGPRRPGTRGRCRGGFRVGRAWWTKFTRRCAVRTHRLESARSVDQNLRAEDTMLDLLVRNAALPDGRTGVDIAVAADRIVEVGAAIGAPAARTLDAAGQLVTPPFVDAHFHLDSALTYGSPRINRSGTLLEGIALWGELKPTLTAEAIAERALSYCDWAVARGLLAIRSHVDTSDP